MLPRPQSGVPLFNPQLCSAHTFPHQCAVDFVFVNWAFDIYELRNFSPLLLNKIALLNFYCIFDKTSSIRIFIYIESNYSPA